MKQTKLLLKLHQKVIVNYKKVILTNLIKHFDYLKEKMIRIAVKEIK
jgi:hypothetical protein